MPIQKQKINLVIAVIALTLVLVPLSASARGLVPCGGEGEKVCTVTDAFVMVARVTNFLIAAAGLMAVYFIGTNSLWIILAIGDEEKLTQNKKGLAEAVIGFILVLFAFMIVNTAVNFILLNGSFLNETTPKCKVNLTNPLSYLTIDYPCKPK